jgi:osmotically inducible lipoprotein OsmB
MIRLRGFAEEAQMRKFSMIAAMFMALVAVPSAAGAQERTITGAAIGAGAGAVIAGPVGAVAGGAVGAVVGGPRITRARAHRHCWRDRRGRRHCRWHRGRH